MSRSWIIGAFFAVCMAASGCAVGAGDLGASGDELSPSCQLVRCAEPLCAEGQRLDRSGGTCCPACVDVGPTASRCAAVLCAAVECPEGEQRVWNGPNDCCGSCRPTRPVAECQTDLDCPQYACIACPCPVSECQGNRCVTWTPDASTCGGDGI